MQPTRDDAHPEDMPQRRGAVRTIVVAIALLAVAALLWLNRQVLVLAFGAVVFATVIRSVAGLLSRTVKLRGRWAVIAAVLLLAAAVAALCWVFGTRVADQVAELQEALPNGVARIQEWAGTLPHGDRLVAAVKDGLESGGLSKFTAVARITTAVVTNIVLMGFAAIYFAVDPDLYCRGIVRLLPPSQRQHVARALGETGDALSRWVRAQLLLMLVVGSLTGIGLALVGVPLAFSLALIIGLFEFIPLLGPILGAIPGILLAFTKSPETALYALLVYVAVQQMENNLLTPLVQRWAVQLPPALGLFAVLAAGITFGLIGVVFATPLAVVTMVLLQHLYVEDTLEHERSETVDRPGRRHQRHAPPTR